MKTRRAWPLFLVLLAVSLALRIYKINQGLWYDEISTAISFTHLPWLKIISSPWYPNNHPLFTLLAKLSVSLFGEKEWTLRLPSLIAGSLTPPVLYGLTRKKIGEAPAFLAGLFLSLSYWSIWFSQDARGYAGLILFSLLSQIYYLRWLENRTGRTALVYTACSAAACYFHLYGIFVISSQMLLGFFQWVSNRKKPGPVIFVLPGLSLALGWLIYLPGISGLIAYSAAHGHKVGERWMNAYFLKDLLNLFSGSQYFSWEILLLVMFIAGLVRLAKAWPKLAALYVSALLMVMLFSILIHFYLYVRFVSFFQPMFYLALAMCFEPLANMIAGKSRSFLLKSMSLILPAALIGSVLALGATRYYRLGKQGFKDAAQYIEKNHPAARVVSLGVINTVWSYYYPLAEPLTGKEPFSPETVRDKLLVCSFPDSWKTWPPQNRRIIRNMCRVEKVWPSAGYEENIVYLLNCFEPKGWTHDRTE